MEAFNVFIRLDLLLCPYKSAIFFGSRTSANTTITDNYFSRYEKIIGCLDTDVSEKRILEQLNFSKILQVGTHFYFLFPSWLGYHVGIL